MKLPEPTPAALNAGLPDNPSASVARALSAGTWLDEFELGEIIGEGSTTIVYGATDRGRAVPVTIAEYMPARLAQRNHEAQVAPQTSAQADAFAKGLKAFINETRTLARCNHPSLVRIVRLWEANGTAYRVMPRYPARRLLEVRLAMNEPPDEEAVRAARRPQRFVANRGPRVFAGTSWAALPLLVRVEEVVGRVMRKRRMTEV